MARTRVHPALALLLAAALALAAAAPPQPAPRARRQLADDASLQPVDDAAEGVEGAAAGREKRKFEGVAQASFGIKNAVLGLVFGKINSIIDSKTRLVETLDRNNIEKNRALGIEPPPSGVSSFGTVFGQLLGPALQSGTRWRLPHSASQRRARQAQPPAPAARDDIPEFDRNKVSLDFPGSLFGPSVSLLIKTTKIVGEVIQNSAVRYQSFLRLFRPLFRGPFEIKGLDPPSTTTTTTTTPAPADNEVRRRR